jgi:hypothetical protein
MLVLATTVFAELAVVTDALSFDAVVLSKAHFYRFTSNDLSTNEVAFERVEAVAGLTGSLIQPVSIRLSADVGSLEPRDLYLDLKSRRGFGLRAGQFLLPLGMDAITEPDSQVLSGSALLVNYAKPLGTRDIGLLGTWDAGRVSAAAGVVNGSGANADDNNGRKDVCARVAVRSKLDGVIALRAYYGWPGASDTAWQTVAAEARVRLRQVDLQVELQNHQGPDSRNNAGYVQACWSAGQLQPVGRFDLILPSREHADWMATAGLNIRPFSVHDEFKIMLNCSYRRNYQDNWSFLAFLVRLQAAI